MYLVLLTIGYCFAYFVLGWVFQLFFPVGKGNKINWQSLLLIIIFSIIAYTASFLMPNLELGNRVLHIFGGGVISFFICYLVVKDKQIKISPLLFFIFSFLIITTMGVANELLEFFLQKFISFIFSANQYDTWWDLLSNLIGILLGALIFIPLLFKRSRL